MFIVVVLTCIVFALSFLFTGIYRHCAPKIGFIDKPNQRSSHSAPMPTGAGIVIAALVVVGGAVLVATNQLSGSDYAALACAGTIIAVIGYWDDYSHLPAKIRILFHFLSSAIIVFAFSDDLVLPLLGPLAVPLWITLPIFLLASVWLLNLYNFMDGIDGFAGVEAVSVCAWLALICICHGALNIALWAGLLGGASLGFLLWNWPPAKVFMGDAGSGFIGISLAGIAMLSISQEVLTLWCWLILLAGFICDASITLIVRFIKREKWYQAHCSHAFQNASRLLGGHLQVTVSLLLVNLLWLGPLAWLSVHFQEMAFGLVLVAYLPLVIICINYRSGCALAR